MKIFAALAEAKWLVFVLMALVAMVTVASVGAIPETTHLVQTDAHGHVIQMDVTFDMEDKTVLAVVGDVSMYPDSVQTVNFHDYNTSYGVLKIVNRRLCLMARPLVPMATPEKYRIGTTTEVHEHLLHFAPDKLTNRDVEVIAGPRIAAFCKDYDTYYTIATPDNGQKFIGRQRRAASNQQTTASNEQTVWCVFSSCKGIFASL